MLKQLPKFVEFLLDIILLADRSTMQSAPLLCLISLLLFGHLPAQDSGLDQFASFHASILAQNHEYPLSHWNLSGPVASMKVSEFGPGAKAELHRNMRYKFDQEGRLTFWMQGDSSCHRYHYKYKIFAFGEAGKLQKIIQYEKYQNAFRLTQSFDHQGYLIQIRFVADEDSSRDFRTHIQYRDQHSKMRIDYQYDHPQSHWERKETENYQFIFDQKGYLIEEIMQGKYAYTKTYKRAPQTGLILTSHHLDACFPSNSCVNLTTHFAYDKAGNLIKTGASDMTVRNSLWTLGDHFEAKYNEQNLLIERTLFKTSGMPSSFSINRGKTQKRHLYEYSHDKKGNWIERREYVEGVLLKTIRRKIRYY